MYIFFLLVLLAQVFMFLFTFADIYAMFWVTIQFNYFACWYAVFPATLTDDMQSFSHFISLSHWSKINPPLGSFTMCWVFKRSISFFYYFLLFIFYLIIIISILQFQGLTHFFSCCCPIPHSPLPSQNYSPSHAFHWCLCLRNKKKNGEHNGDIIIFYLHKKFPGLEKGEVASESGQSH